MNRRTFLQQSAIAGSTLAAAPFMLRGQGQAEEYVHLTILHTNDVHSRIEPFPMDGSRNQGLGGASRRAWLISEIRKKSEHVLLLDAGDMLQGTPYFNVFGGELEFKLMTEMGYDAATIGNHEFDGGMESLAKQLQYADFPILNANYDFSNTPMAGKTKEYAVFTRGGIRIGVFGVGIELQGLVPASLYGNTIYLDPIRTANKVADALRYEHKCDYVICLSHLGYKYDDQKVSDQVLAKETREIDLILGGHTHTFLSKPDIVQRSNGRPVTINQAGWAGILLGQLEVVFERNRKGHCISCKNIPVQAN